MAPDFLEIGASGRRYDRSFVQRVWLERYAADDEDPWATSDFHCRQLGTDTYLLTYTLRQDARLTRRATTWRSGEQGWQVVYHQRTPVT